MENIIDKTHIESVWADLNMVIHMFIHCEIVPYSPSNWKKKGGRAAISLCVNESVSRATCLKLWNQGYENEGAAYFLW